MTCIVHVIREYPLQTYCLKGQLNFNKTSYQVLLVQIKQKLRYTGYYVMQMTGSTLPATGRDLI